MFHCYILMSLVIFLLWSNYVISLSKCVLVFRCDRNIKRSIIMLEADHAVSDYLQKQARQEFDYN